MRYAVIMAGGAGVRLWPLSRKSRPKQLLKLFGGTSLLRQSYERCAALIPPERICVITSQSHLPAIADELPELPAENLFGEPVGRDTANAVGMSAAILAKRDQDAVIGVFTADHIISPMTEFVEAVEKAYGAAEEHRDALITIGVRPTRPDINYGYVRRGDRISDALFEVSKFAEKPNMTTAMKYLASGEHYWNSGMFAWRADTILEQIKTHLPQSYDGMVRIGNAWGRSEQQSTIEQVYPELMRISIDFAVLEHAKKVLVVEMGCHWVDVGAWPAMEAVIQADADGNVAACEDVVHLGSRGNIVVSEDKHLVATVGVDDLIIVHSADATLICKRRDTQCIKELVDNVHSTFGSRYE